MKKLSVSIILLMAFIGVSFAANPELDVWYAVPWLGTNGSYTVLTDAKMQGLKDTSALVPLLSGIKSLTVFIDADSGTTGAVIGDNDSIGYRGYYIYPGQALATGVAMDGLSADSLLNGASSDSGATGSYHIVHLSDSFFTVVAIPPPDTATGSAALRYYYTGNDYDNKAAYFQFTVHTTDSTAIGNTLWIKQNSLTAAAIGSVTGFNKK